MFLSLLSAVNAQVPTKPYFGGPCGEGSCKDPEAQRLDDAYQVDATTIEQRNKMREIIRIHTNRSGTDWSRATEQYFKWREWSIRCDPQTSIARGPSCGSDPSLAYIKMIKDGGVFKINAIINETLTLNCILDSGAADVSVPSDVVSVLMRMGTLSYKDFLGSQTYVLADGSRVPSMRFIIRSIKVGDEKVENVVGSISSSNSEILLGQSFFQKFRVPLGE